MVKQGACQSRPLNCERGFVYARHVKTILFAFVVVLSACGPGLDEVPVPGDRCDQIGQIIEDRDNARTLVCEPTSNQFVPMQWTKVKL